MSFSCRDTVRPWNPVTWLVLPAALLIWIAFFPPHTFDLWVSSFLHDGSAFWLQHAKWARTLHNVLRAVPWTVGLGAVWVLVQNLRGKSVFGGAGNIGVPRAVYLLIAMLAVLFLVKFLKDTTGVHCPFSLEAFGGKNPLLNPSWSFETRPGHCWPSGFAGTAFCLFPVYFAYRDLKPELSRKIFAAIMLFGVFCSFLQMVRGEHFLTHVAATGLIDWLVSAALYLLMTAVFYRKKSV